MPTVNPEREFGISAINSLFGSLPAKLISVATGRLVSVAAGTLVSGLRWLAELTRRPGQFLGWGLGGIRAPP